MRVPPNQPPAPPRKRRRRKSLLLSFLGYGFAAAVVAFLVASAGAGYLLWKFSQDLPDYESLSKYEPPVMTRIHAHNGALIAEYARERRIFEARRLSEDPITLETLSEEFGVSRERVRQIEVRAFEKVQKAVQKASRELERPRLAVAAS